MEYIQLYEAFSGDHKQASEAYSALFKLIDVYDGYASEQGVEKDDRYWGDMEAINAEIDEILGASGSGKPSKVKTTADVITHWDALVSIAKKVADGAEGYVAERGDEDRYGKGIPGKIKKVKKLFGIKEAKAAPVKEAKKNEVDAKVQKKVDTIKGVFFAAGYKVDSEELTGGTGKAKNMSDMVDDLPELTLCLSKEANYEALKKIARKIRDVLDLDNQPRVEAYPDEDGKKNQVVIDLF